MAPDIANHVAGYYEVGSHFFTNKSDALVEASRLKLWPKYHFFDHVWRAQNWTDPGHTDLYDLYRQRARQLREKYDYVCLSFSGGSDSTTALQAFIDSNTVIDEIMVRWPIEATENLPVGYHRDPGNYISEWALTIKPMLQRLEQQLGNRTRITVLDWSKDVVDRYMPEEFLWRNSTDRHNPSMMIKHTKPSAPTRAAIESGLRTCIIFGRDKPEMIHRKGRIYCRFVDKYANGYTFEPWDKYVEMFFWTADMPEIVSAQAQTIFQHLKKNPHLVDLIDIDFKNDKEKFHAELQNQVWFETVKSLIYPAYVAQNWFQAKKPTSMVNDEIDQWMFTNPLTAQYIQSWRSVLTQRFNQIDQRFIETRAGVPTGFVGFVSSTHLVGTLDQRG